MLRALFSRPIATVAQRAVAVQSRSMITEATGINAINQKWGRLDGKVAVVAGAGNGSEEEWGIGTCTAIQFARQGAKVVVVSNVLASAQNAVEVIKAEGGDALAVEADCTDFDQTKTIVDKTLAKFGRADVMCNAGVHTALPQGFKKLSHELWHKCIDINFHAHFNLIHQFLPTFEEQGTGNIIHVTTMAGTVGLGLGKQRHGYAAAKAGAAVLTQRIGTEFAAKGIRANVVQVGYVRSPLVTRAVKQVGGDDALQAKVTAQRDSYVASGKQGEPMDVANACVFLASDESAFVNSSNLYCDGGQCAVTYGP